jgi:hypothetical protein
MIIETKFSPEDTVWVMINNKPKKCTIYELIPGKQTRSITYVNTYSIHGNYNGNSPVFSENDLFKTKEELINSL